MPADATADQRQRVGGGWHLARLVVEEPGEPVLGRRLAGHRSPRPRLSASLLRLPTFTPTRTRPSPLLLATARHPCLYADAAVKVAPPRAAGLDDRRCDGGSCAAAGLMRRRYPAARASTRQGLRRRPQRPRCPPISR